MQKNSLNKSVISRNAKCISSLLSIIRLRLVKCHVYLIDVVQVQKNVLYIQINISCIEINVLQILQNLVAFANQNNVKFFCLFCKVILQFLLKYIKLHFYIYSKSLFLLSTISQGLHVLINTRSGGRIAPPIYIGNQLCD